MLGNSKKIYMIGIKGTGMSSLAVLLKKLGYSVSGSDVHEEFPSELQLKHNAIPYFNGFDAKQVAETQPDLVIISTAYNDRNVEVAETKLKRISHITYPEAVGEISKKLISIAICGSHGKTTTTSMLGAIMQTNKETMTLTGTVAEALNSNVENIKYFVFEADEYQNKFQYYSPANVILTNIDFDHPDYFKDDAHYQQTFADFILRTLESGGYIIYNYDDVSSRTLFRGIAGTYSSYGFDPGAEYHITDISHDLNEFTIRTNGEEFLRLKLSSYGRHNILDATGAALMALHLGISKEIIAEELKNFKGIQRRMQIYPSDKFIVIDDYGHHPTEIAITLEAIRNKYPDKQLITVFHPHTYTRTKALLKEFGGAFQHADLVLVLDIFPSAREIAGGVHAEEVVKELEKNETKAVYTPDIPDAADYILKNIPHGSVIVTMGAGDAWKLCELIK